MNPGDTPYRVPTIYLWIAVLAFLMILAACGGGGGAVASVGSGGTGAAISGPISGFGSIIVNGVRIDDSNADITLDGERTQAGSADLKLGMMVDVEAQRDPDGTTGKASTIATRSFVKGPVSAIDTTAGQLTVLGVTVTVSARTVFDGAGVTGLGSLKVNDAVEVHGIADSTGGLKATRIERVPALTDVSITGVVQQGAGSSSFAIRNYTVQYQPADLIDLKDGISAGMLVRVTGTLSGATIDARSIRAVRVVPAAKNQQQVELEGVVTAFTSTSAFEVNGLPVSVPSSAKVKGTVALGAQVEVGGKMDNDILVASKVEVDEGKPEQEEEAFEMHGTIHSYDPVTGTFTMRNGTVTIEVDDKTKFDKGAQRGLAAGMKVEVKGKMRGNVLVASTVQRED